MRFLVDQCLSVELTNHLAAAGHDAVHVASYGLSRADDAEILARAAIEGRVLLSADTEFGGLLAAEEPPGRASNRSNRPIIPVGGSHASSAS